MSRRVSIRAFDVAVGVAALGGASLVVAILERGLGLPDASIVFVVGVTVVAVRSGTPAALLASVAAFLLYDFLFIDPLYTFTVADPREWLTLLVLLVVSAVVGRLTGLLADRAADANRREREARHLFGVSREIATTADAAAALPQILDRLVRDGDLVRAWVEVGEGSSGRILADTDMSPHPVFSVIETLRRTPGDSPAAWTRIHLGPDPAGGSRDITRGRTATADVVAFRVAIDAGGETLGWLWSIRDRSLGRPSREATRLLAAAADLVGVAVRRDRLAADATTAEVTRRSEAVKSALLESVSHDLRTPLAAIRAAAGSLMDPQVELSPADRLASAATIDREAEHLNRLVTNLLDLSRIEAGGLRAEPEAVDLEDTIERALARLAPRLRPRPLTVEIDGLAPVVADPVFLDQIVTNILENAAKYTPADAPVRIAARELVDPHRVRLTIEDGGPGVPAEALARLFEKFYRVPRQGEGSRPGTGIGLAVARGLADSMGGRVAARTGELGGLAIDLELPAATLPPDAADVPASEPSPAHRA